MNIIRILIAWFIILSLFSVKDIPADYIYLKDGSVISGILIEKKEKLLIYRVAYGEMFINRENIDKIIYEDRDKPLLRETERYLKDEKFQRAIKTCGEVLEINPDSREAMEFKQKAITAWHRYAAEKEEERIREAERIRQEKEKRERIKQSKNAQADLKNRWGMAIRKEINDYVIVNIYATCPLRKGEIQSGDILIAIQDTMITGLSDEKVYNLLLSSNKIELVIQRPVVLTREKIIYEKKEYVGLGISIEKTDRGIKVTTLTPNGPAAKAGVLKDDIITSLAERTLASSSMDEIAKMLKGTAGTSLKATIERKVILEK